MRKFLIAAVAAVIAVVGGTVLATADEGAQGTSWEFKFSTGNKARAAGSNTVINPAKTDTKGNDDPSDDHYIEPEVTTIKFPKGSSIDTTVLPRCKASPSDVQTRRATCPSNTRIGSGFALSAAGQPDEGGGTELAAPIEAYNRKNGILFVVKPCAPGTGPTKPKPCQPVGSADVVLLGSWSKITTQPTLRVPTPASLKGRVIIKRFALKTAKKTKKATVNGRTVIRSYATTPGTCKGTWKSSAVIKYTDGSSQTIPDSQPCTR